MKPHSYISRAQSTYLQHLKETIDESSVIILGDFAENYSFVVQDEIQSFHWVSLQCSFHPVVAYYHKDDTLLHISYCAISDDITHDISFVHKLLAIIIPDLKEKNSGLKNIHIFSDCCAGQYKNCKTLYNLCQL